MKKIRLGTRGSPLALRQTEMVRAALAQVRPDVATEVVIIKTSGDWDPASGEARLLESAGGKGQFAKEIEEALLKREIDAGIHSMKDMETRLPGGLKIDHMLPREDARDAFIFNGLAKDVQSLGEIPKNMVIGTCSVRRQALLLSRRPDLKIVPLRGNVQTRLDKLKKGEQGMGEILLAMAGLKRLGLEGEADLAIDIEDMLPAAGQGAVGIEIREKDEEMSAIFGQISCFKTVTCVKSERASLEILSGSCHTPIGAHARLCLGQLTLKVGVATLDGSQSFYEEETTRISDEKEAVIFGQKIGQRLKDKIPPELLKQVIA